jgi:hypothetical protein
MTDTTHAFISKPEIHLETGGLNFELLIVGGLIFSADASVCESCHAGLPVVPELYRNASMLKLRTPEDIQCLSGYVPEIDPAQTPLKRIVDYYYLRPFEIKCALCGASHMDGCIVELENGRLTNIGHICGKHFGERFAEEKRKFNESRRKPELIKKMIEASTRLSSMHFELQELKHRAGAMARRAQNLTKLFPDLHKELFRRAVNNQYGVSVSVELSEEELDDAKASNPHKIRADLRFREEGKGALRGHKLPAIDWSFREGVRSLFIEAEKFVNLSPRSMSMQDLTKWANWSEDLDEAIARLVSANNEAEEFFTRENFQLFQFLPLTTEARDKLKSFNLAMLDMLPVFEAQPEEPTLVPAKSQRRAIAVPRNRLSPKELRRLTGNKRAR